MNVALFGATGMVGMGTLLECLDAPQVTAVMVVGRNACGVTHTKLTEIIHPDLYDLRPIAASLTNCDATFYCLGVSTVGMTEAAYTHITYDLTVAIAKVMLAAAPSSVFIFVSGQGADSAENGSVMWTRVKAKTENALFALGFRHAWMFRPGLIQPMRGVRSRTRWYRVFYALFGPFSGLWIRIAPGVVTNTINVGRAMIRVAADGFDKTIVMTRDINTLGAH